MLKSRNFIVNPADVLKVEAIREDKPVLVNFSFRNNIECVEWLAKRRLLHNEYVCLQCGEHMSFAQRKCREGFQWSCRICRKSISIKTDSCFSRSRLALERILRIMYGWAKDWMQKDIAAEAELGRKSTHTVVDWCLFCRDICQIDLLRNSRAIGGIDDDFVSKVVEIDESLFLPGKCDHGEINSGHWVFGGVERGSGKCFLVEVPDRSAETLDAMIEEYILPGTLIISDGWRGYSNINQIGGGIYEAQIGRRMQTQNIQNLWSHAKRKMRRQYGTSKSQFPTYLAEFMWRRKHRNSDPFAELILAVQQQYDL